MGKIRSRITLLDVTLPIPPPFFDFSLISTLSIKLKKCNGFTLIIKLSVLKNKTASLLKKGGDGCTTGTSYYHILKQVLAISRLLQVSSLYVWHSLLPDRVVFYLCQNSVNQGVRSTSLKQPLLAT